MNYNSYNANCGCPSCSFKRAMDLRQQTETEFRKEYSSDPRSSDGLSASGSGNSTHQRIAREIATTVDEKQAAYGDSFGKSGAVLAILYPNGVSVPQLDDALTVTRILDKLFRIATDKDALGESPYRDIAGYALLAVAKGEKP